MQIVSGKSGFEVGIEQIEIQAGSALTGTTLKDSNLRQLTNAMIVAIRKASTQQTLFNPSPTTLLEQEDILIAIGTKESLDKLAELARSSIG
jgi:voltage-gated potassium channel